MCYSLLVEQDLKKLGAAFDAEPHPAAFVGYHKMQERDSNRFKSMADNPRIYPNYFAPIVVPHEDRRQIYPMRYRLRPHDAREEIPSRYNVFNARLDALETRHSWRPLFMKRHGVVAIHAFFEWITTVQGDKKVVMFRPGDHSLLWVPVLWDTWVAGDGSEGFASFAVITTTPPPEVEEAGHDRCPIILNHDHLDAWLHPEKTGRRKIYEILEERWDTRFECQAAAP